MLEFEQLLWLGLRIISMGLAVYGLICAAIFWGQSRLIFAPHKRLDVSPKSANVEFQEVWIPVVDHRGQHAQLHAWWLPHATSQQVLLYCHGKLANIGRNLERALRLRDLGLSVLLFDYRGYGRSSGPFPHEAQVYADASAAWNYLTQERQFAPQEIFIYGHSIGGAIGIELASRQPQAAGLIVQGTFTSLPAMAIHQGWTRLFPLRLLRQEFDSLGRVGQLQLPVLYLHGLADRLVPAEMAQQLFAATASVHKGIALFPEAGHNDLARVAGEACLSEIRTFIERSVARKIKPVTTP